MYKPLFSLSLFLLVAVCGSAQIVFQDSTDYPRPAMFTDSVQILINAIPYPSEGTDQQWDFSSLPLGVTAIDEYTDERNNPDFPDAFTSFEDNLGYTIGTTEYEIPSRVFEKIDEQGWSRFGRTMDSVTIPLTAITGGANDRIDYLQTGQLYRGRLDFVKFPMRYGDAWNESYSWDVNYNLTAGALGLNETPGFSREITIQDREVVGSGTIVIPTANREPSAPIEALLIKGVRTTIDSFYLGGAPTPPNLLAVLGLTQGVTNVDSFYVFYARGFGAPLMNLDFLINGFVTRIEYRPRAASTVSSISDFNIPPALNFPNPATAGTSISISLQQAANAGNMVFFNTTGQVVGEVPYNAGGEKSFTIDLPATLPKGTLWYRVVDRSGKPLGVGKIQLL